MASKGLNCGGILRIHTKQFKPVLLLVQRPKLQAKLASPLTAPKDLRWYGDRERHSGYDRQPAFLFF